MKYLSDEEMRQLKVGDVVTDKRSYHNSFGVLYTIHRILAVDGPVNEISHSQCLYTASNVTHPRGFAPTFGFVSATDIGNYGNRYRHLSPLEALLFNVEL